MSHSTKPEPTSEQRKQAQIAQRVAMVALSLFVGLPILILTLIVVIGSFIGTTPEELAAQDRKNQYKQYERARNAEMERELDRLQNEVEYSRKQFQR